MGDDDVTINVVLASIQLAIQKGFDFRTCEELRQCLTDNVGLGKLMNGVSDAVLNTCLIRHIRREVPPAVPSAPMSAGGHAYPTPSSDRLSVAGERVDREGEPLRPTFEPDETPVLVKLTVSSDGHIANLRAMKCKEKLNYICEDTVKDHNLTSVRGVVTAMWQPPAPHNKFLSGRFHVVAADDMDCNIAYGTDFLRPLSIEGGSEDEDDGVSLASTSSVQPRRTIQKLQANYLRAEASGPSPSFMAKLLYEVAMEDENRKRLLAATEELTESTSPYKRQKRNN